jgi:hypothetical protein
MGGAAATIAAMGVLKGVVDPKMTPGLSSFLASPFWYALPLLLMAVGGAAHFFLKPRLADSAELILDFYGDDRIPLAKKHAGVWRWYWHFMVPVAIPNAGDPGHGVVVSGPGVLFLTFDPEVWVTTLRVESSVPIPRWEVRDFNHRFAVITFAGLVPACTMTITVKPPPSS